LTFKTGNFIFSALNAQMLSENNDLAREQQQKLKYMDNVVYQNRPTMAYFEQFNTTSR
jgi:hypothetical protein